VWRLDSQVIPGVSGLALEEMTKPPGTFEWE
jgi:hypothetical protein